ncbi:MAG TPA: M48 family metallopeptidase [Lacunisphaera sp.]|jgi:Zn-dependent protease with chaperone function|nr:M48 family metallopeptidase [Lacunisphaera sp.]
MDFFEAQARARRRTQRLVWLFILAVIGTIGASYVAVMLIYGQVQPRSRQWQRDYWDYQHTARWPESQAPTLWWDPRVFTGVVAGTLAVVGIASLYKWNQMRQGGAAIAELVGATPVDATTKDFKERQLLNVVEEMAIASGIPVPAVYLLKDEPGLNAFAAGLTTSDAAVVVTRGSLDRLTRDELQGVIGHEFSHILNGDMRLNVRIMALVFGILVIGLIGRGILYSLGRGGRVRVGGDRKGGGIVLVLAAGVALMIIGYIGYFFGRLIQAAVSRQREFLADASSVQFTRNPAGITGALRKIGGYAIGGDIADHRSAQLSHFFFAQAFRSGFTGLWATHPRLEERIRAIDPAWDGKLYEPAEVVDVAHESFATAGFGGGQRYPADETARRVLAAEADVPPSRPVVPVAFKPAHIVADVGAITEAHFRHALTLLNSVPTRLREAARDTSSAQLLVYGLLLSGTREERDRQQALVTQLAGAEAGAGLGELRSSLSVLDPVARLPLLQLALPALRTLRDDKLDRFFTTLDELVHADGRVTPFEFAMQKMLLRQLNLARQPSQAIQFDSFDAVRQDIAVTLSALAHLSPKDSAAAFGDGIAQIPVLARELALLAPEASGLEQLDAALDRLAVCSLVIKQRVLVAAAHVIASDGQVSVEEGELFRALAATLDCPMPSVGMAA